MSPSEREEQRRSFAYGNAVMENPRITRKSVDDAAESLRETVDASQAADANPRKIERGDRRA